MDQWQKLTSNGNLMGLEEITMLVGTTVVLVITNEDYGKKNLTS
jgi:hypothetical protein